VEKFRGETSTATITRDYGSAVYCEVFGCLGHHRGARHACSGRALSQDIINLDAHTTDNPTLIERKPPPRGGFLFTGGGARGKRRGLALEPPRANRNQSESPKGLNLKFVRKKKEFWREYLTLSGERR